jgi:quinol monooxygenase YgiN
VTKTDEGIMAFGLCGNIVATPGNGDALAAHLLHAAAALEDVAACQLYLVSRAPDDPDTLWVFEVWDDAAAHQASLDLPAVRLLIGQARPIIAGMPQRIELRPVGGKGLGSPPA